MACEATVAARDCYAAARQEVHARDWKISSTGVWNKWLL